MSLRRHTPCDERDTITGLHICPYAYDGAYVNCEWWCGADEPEDDPSMWDEVIYESYDMEGGYTND